MTKHPRAAIILKGLVLLSITSVLGMVSGRAQPASGNGHRAKEASFGENRERAYEIRKIEGWTAHVNLSLVKEERALIDRAMELLDKQLQEIARVVPAKAVARLREVQLWFSPEYPGVKPTAEYPSGRRLAAGTWPRPGDGSGGGVHQHPRV